MNRSEELRVRLTESERKDLEVLASQAGLTLSETVRVAVFGLPVRKAPAGLKQALSKGISASDKVRAARLLN